MIRVKSPYYVITPFVSPASGETSPSYTLQVFIWSGDKDSPPAEPTIEKTKVNYENSTGNGSLEIGLMIGDYIDFTLPSFNLTTTDVVSFYNANKNNLWVKWQVIYNTGETEDETPQLEVTKLVTKGFNYGNEGLNVESNITVRNYDLKSEQGGFEVIPIKLNETTSLNLSVISYPDNEVNETFAMAGTIDSNEIIKYLLIKTELENDQYIQVKLGAQILANIFTNNECMYTTYTIIFQNKYGCVEQMKFFKERKNTLNVKSQTYETAIGQPLDGIHQFQSYNVNGNETFNLTTGYVSESLNLKIKDMMLSDNLWVYETPLGFTTNTNFIPVNLKSTTFQEKNILNDNLINYSFDFEYSFNAINTI